MNQNKPLITFVATAHYECGNKRIFIPSILNQSSQNFNAIVFHNGPDIEMRQWVNNQIDNKDYIKFKNSSVDTGNYGCTNRQQAIEECKTEYIIQTSIQDYFLPQAVQFILQGLEAKPDILVWNSINHLVGPCKVLDAKLAWSKLDWGNFAMKTSIAKQLTIQGDQYCADWLFIKEALDKGLIKTAKKLPYVLTIHN